MGRHCKTEHLNRLNSPLEDEGLRDWEQFSNQARNDVWYSALTCVLQIVALFDWAWVPCWLNWKSNSVQGRQAAGRAEPGAQFISIILFVCCIEIHTTLPPGQCDSMLTVSSSLAVTVTDPRSTQPSLYHDLVKSKLKVQINPRTKLC